MHNNLTLIRQFVFLISLVVLSSCGGGGGRGGSGSDNNPSDPQLSGSCSFRIVNGDSCPKGKGPIALLAAVGRDGGINAICSGAFLSSTKVLTAAHCSELAAFGTITVYSGEESSIVTSFVVDSRYSEATDDGMIHDTAIATLATPIDVTPLSLLASSSPEEGDNLLVYGYGSDENGDTPAAEILGNGAKRARLQLQSNDNGVLVAEFDDSGEGACEGDSGGPVLAQNSNGEWAITAVVRGGTVGNCLQGTTEVFVGVQTPGSIDFILSQVPGAGLL